MTTGHRLKYTCLYVLLILIFTTTVPAQDSLNVTMLGSIYSHWSYTEDVAVSGNYAYVAGAGLRVIYIRLPANTYEVGHCLTETGCKDVVVSGDYAYVANSYDGLTIVNISDPANPAPVGNCDTPGRADGVYYQDGYAYVADYTGDLRIIDVSDPANPVETGHCDIPVSSYDVVVSGDYAYVSGYGLYVIDISDPTSPDIVGRCETPGWGLGVAVQGNYAYVADRDDGLRVVDISDPTFPFEVGSYVPNYVFIDVNDVAVSGNFAYIAMGGSGYSWCDGIDVIDISNPSSPDYVGNCETPSNADGVTVSGNYSYVACQNYGLRIIDVANPNSPVEVGYYYDDGWVYETAVSGDIVCVTDEPAGLRLIDVSDPTAPEELGVFDTPGGSREVEVRDDLAYIADGSTGLLIVNIADPANPFEEGRCSVIGNAECVAIEGNFAYIMSSGIYKIDISDPQHPLNLGYYQQPWYYEVDIDASGDYVYLVSGGIGLQIVDFSDPLNPFLAGSCTAGWGRGVDVSGDYAYVTDQSGLWIFDVSNPGNPWEIGSCDLMSCTFKVTVLGNYAYVSAEYDGLRIVDVSDPANPVEVGYYEGSPSALGVAVDGEYIYVGAGPYMGIYEFSAPELSIALTPLNPPIQIPAGGGTFEFNIAVSNQGSSTAVFDVWTMTTLPDGSQYGPIINVSQVELSPGISVNRDRIQNVPVNAPPGDYTYDAYIGVYPDVIWEEDHFEFEKLITGDLGEFVNNWANTGESFITETVSEIHHSSFNICFSAFPNPFNQRVALDFALPATAPTKLTVYDIMGREVAKLVDSYQNAGNHNVVFDAKDFVSGVYFVRFEAGDFRQTQKLLLIK